jgi:hypothetical protein
MTVELACVATHRPDLKCGQCKRTMRAENLPHAAPYRDLCAHPNAPAAVERLVCAPATVLVCLDCGQTVAP